MPASISEYVPQLVTREEASRRVRSSRVAWGVAAACALGLVCMILLAPLLRARGALLLSQVLYQAFHPLCHQMPGRSFQIEGFPLAVCARCTGLYAGALAGLLAYPLARTLARTDVPRRAWLILAALPTSVDFALGVLGVWENTHLSRFFTALLLGAASAFYIAPGMVGLGLTPWKQLFRPRPLVKS